MVNMPSNLKYELAKERNEGTTTHALKLITEESQLQVDFNNSNSTYIYELTIKNAFHLHIFRKTFNV